MANFIDPSKIEEFKLLQLEGKRLASIGDLKASLHKFELAKQICPTAKVLQRIEKLKACLKVDDGSEKSQLPHLSSTSLADYNAEIPHGLKSTDESVFDLKIPNEAKTESKILSEIQNIQSNLKPSEKKSDSSELSPQSRLKFKQLKNEAKQLALDGKYNEAVNCFKRALSIYDCPNVKKYLKTVESFVLSNGELTKEHKDQSVKESQHASNFVQESQGHNSTVMQPVVTNKLTENPKDQFEEKKHSSESIEESVEQKSSLSESKDDSYIERKLAEVKIIYEEARELSAVGKLTEALKLLKEAQAIHQTQKVQKRIDKLEEIIAADLNSTDEENKFIEITKGFSIYHEIYNKLYPYQREGVAWMWNLYKMGKGGVLGDDMGLGKTFQVIAFISGMIDADLIKHALIIMPVSLLKNWEKEFKKWCPGIAVHDFHSGTKKERERNKLKVQRRGHVLLTSYGMIVNNVNLLTEMDGSEFVWDYVILDEGHKIKNPTKTTKAVYDIPAKNRLVLTGTPIQNNLRELWSLYDFVHQGTLLGSLKTFKLQYENPITRSREKDATVGEKRLGSEMADNLKAVIKPYFLRRTKDVVWGNNDADKEIENLENQMENMKISKLTTKKNDLILWTYMSEPQIAIYQDFLHSDAVKSILVSKRSPLVELTTLKKICDHPRLLSQRACFHLGLNGDLQHGDQLDLDDESTLASSIDNVTDESLLKESGKLKLVIDLLEHLKETGHRTLVFSLSRKILDMIHRILVNKNWKVMRLDGTIAKTADREKRIVKFQRDPSYPVFLLTTQVGGVGITLTAADRVIIYDPSWNPATDAQAVDRAYRIGQQKDVVVYRLITCGTVEEKIYRRQIFKDSITRQATGVADPFRYFSKQELRELFSLDDPRYSATQVQLHEMHSSQRSTYDELEKHLEFLRRLNIFGISDHDLMFSKQVEDNTEDNDPNAISEHFIKQKVAAAHAQIQMEANVVAEGIRLAGTFNRPYQETIPLSKKTLIKDPYKPPALPDVVDLTEDAQSEVLPNTIKRTSFASKNTYDDEDIKIVSSRSQNDLSVRTSFTSKNNYDDEDEDIKIVSPRSQNDISSCSDFFKKSFCDSAGDIIQTLCHKSGSILHEDKDASPIEKKSEIAFPSSNKLSLITSPPKDCTRFPEIGNYSYSENAVDYAQTQFRTNLEAISFKTEKLRKSSFNKPFLQDKVDDEELLENPSEEDINLDETRVHNIKNKPSEDDVEQLAPSDIKPLDITCDMKEKFQANLTHLMNDDLPDLSFDEEEPPVTLKKGRKSCARQSTFIISESDSSCPNSASNSIISENLVDESEGIKSDFDDSSNSASISFIPESATNTPQTSHYLKDFKDVSVSKTPSFHLEPQLLSGKNSPILDLKKPEGSVKRITPLKVHKSYIQEDSSFVKAMANSLIITPETSPRNEQIHLEVNASEHASSDEEEDDSPIRIVKKKAMKRIYSDSDESDAEYHTRNEDHYSIENKSFQEHLKSLSSEEEEQNYSENGDSKKEQDVLSNHSNEEQFDSDDGEDEEEVLSNHSEDSLSGSDSDSEDEEENDLEQTFATCKDKTDSNSDYDESSENSDDSSGSDDSGSLFNEDD